MALRKSFSEGKIMAQDRKEKSPFKVDEDGNVLVDENGWPIWVKKPKKEKYVLVEGDENGNVLVDENGKPILIRTYDPLEIFILSCGTPLEKLLMGALLKGAEAEDRYIPATQARHPKYCRGHNTLVRILGKNPWIRTRKPRRFRLLVRFLDWVKYLEGRAAADGRRLEGAHLEVAELTVLATAREGAAQGSAKEAATAYSGLAKKLSGG